MSQMWSPEFLENEPSIGYLELYAVVAAVLNWIDRFSNQRVILFCDNLGVCNMINFTTSGCKNCMVLIRILVLKSMVANVRVFAKHLSSKSNFLADDLSRNKINSFKKSCKKLGKSLDAYPYAVPEQIWPVEKIWLK